MYIPPRDAGIFNSERNRWQWDNPAYVKLCYFNGVAANPAVFHGTHLGMGYVTNGTYDVRICDFVVGFFSLSDAQEFADAMNVLKKNSGI